MSVRSMSRSVGALAACVVGLMVLSAEALGAVTPGWECLPTTAGQPVVSGGTGSSPSCGAGTTAVLAPTYFSSGVDGKPTVKFAAVNVQIINGAGSTASLNGTGNLVVGYNENPARAPQTGSHDLILGRNQSFTGYAELVGGFNNTASGPYTAVLGASNAVSASYATVTGGQANIARATAASVSGGFHNTAASSFTSVTGGCSNLAGTGSIQFSGSCGDTTANPNSFATVTGGAGNQASQTAGSISAGEGNLATDPFASVVGGCDNLAGGGTIPGTGCNTTGLEMVGGGKFNAASALGASVTGGQNNSSSATNTSISGGYSNSASAEGASVSGGNTNFATAPWSSVLGGDSETASNNCQSIPATNTC